MRRTVWRVALCLAGAAGTGHAQHHGVGTLDQRSRDPSMAALLSIQPLPVDAGGFYAGNWRRDQPADMFSDEIRVGTTWADVTPVPEPGTLALALAAGCALLVVRRFPRRK